MTHNCPPRSKFAIKMATLRPDDAFIDLTAGSILGMIILSIAANLAFQQPFPII